LPPFGKIVKMTAEAIKKAAENKRVERMITELINPKTESKVLDFGAHATENKIWEKAAGKGIAVPTEVSGAAKYPMKLFPVPKE
jgi:hypothetical protein